MRRVPIKTCRHSHKSNSRLELVVPDGRDECDKSNNDAQGGAIFAKEKETSDVLFSASSLCLNIIVFSIPA